MAFHGLPCERSSPSNRNSPLPIEARCRSICTTQSPRLCGKRANTKSCWLAWKGPNKARTSLVVASPSQVVGISTLCFALPPGWNLLVVRPLLPDEALVCSPLNKPLCHAQGEVPHRGRGNRQTSANKKAENRTYTLGVALKAIDWRQN
eukprot:6214720-Pleurochrysis_carterae.AAC.3